MTIDTLLPARRSGYARVIIWVDIVYDELAFVLNRENESVINTMAPMMIVKTYIYVYSV
jgi:hypothetical protein